MTLYFSLHREVPRQRAGPARPDGTEDGRSGLNAGREAEGRDGDRGARGSTQPGDTGDGKATTLSAGGSAGSHRSVTSGRGVMCGSEIGARYCEGARVAGSRDIERGSGLKDAQKSGQKKGMEHIATGCTSAPSSQTDGSNSTSVTDPSMNTRVTFEPPAKDKGKGRGAKLLENKQGCAITSEKSLGNKTDDGEENLTMKGCKTRCITLPPAKKSQSCAGQLASDGTKKLTDTQSTPSSTPTEEGGQGMNFYSVCWHRWIWRS